MNRKQLVTTALLAILASGCATVRETYTDDGKVAHTLTCSGTARDWNMCYEAAGNLCKAAGYTVVSKSEDSRENTFATINKTFGSYSNTTVKDRNMVVTCNTTKSAAPLIPPTQSASTTKAPDAFRRAVASNCSQSIVNVTDQVWAELKRNPNSADKSDAELAIAAATFCTTMQK